MSNSGGYGFGNDYSYGYDYSSQTQNSNQGYGYSDNASNFNSYASPYSQSSTNKPQTEPQPFNPTASLLSNPAAQIGMQFGTQAISAGQEYVNSNVKYF